MTNHFEIALRKLQKADDVGNQLVDELSKPEPDRQKVGLYATRLRAHVKRAEVHAKLAEVQAIHDLTAAILTGSR